MAIRLDHDSHLFSNYLRTGLLMAALLALLAIGGRAIGGAQGMLTFGAIGLALNFVMYWFSDKLALLAHRAQEVSRAEAPTLYAIVERLTRRADMPMPRLYIIPSAAANAFATGRNPMHAAVAVTDGILQILSDRELEAVLAHELSHVKNRDVLIATVAAGVAGLISTIGHVLQWGLMFGGGSRNDEDRGGGLAALAWIFVAPIIALLIQLAISRSREYGADASGGALTGDPDALADALETLEQTKTLRPYEFGGPATAHLFIVNPLRGGAAAALLGLFSTHPPVEERVHRLRELARRLGVGGTRARARRAANF
ncbi:MAG TPA: zinc metalloprotease HtpX [Polyangia bacterium]|jgi:heat shock protein HtpX|nr:zinc metalloprotease HtpX [Polyangia bacterium]